MVPASCVRAFPVSPPAYHRAQAKIGPALHIDALTLITHLHLLALCRLAVHLAQRRCAPPLPAGPGGRPRIYADESLLSPANVHDAPFAYDERLYLVAASSCCGCFNGRNHSVARDRLREVGSHVRTVL
jgi:hypothetical protein